MNKRLRVFFLLVVATSVLLAGCGKDPDKLFKEGKYDKAYPEFIKRAGTNETALKTVTTNAANADSRIAAGNQAIHDLYYAAECQKKLGNTAEANGLYKRVVDLSNYKIQVPADRSVLLKDSLDSLLRAARDVRYQEVSYGQAYRDWQNQPSGNTDPYDDDDTDPYDNHGSSGSNTDPYNNHGSSGSNTDPYNNHGSSGSNTDPYGSSTGSSGSNTDPYDDDDDDDTDPYAYSSSTSAPSRFWLDNSISTLATRRRDFERTLYSTTAAQVPDIEAVKKEYERYSRALDSYLQFASPGNFLFSPDSIASQLAWNTLEGNATSVQRVAYAAKGNVVMTDYPFTLKEPGLVDAARSAIGASASAPAATTPAGATTPSTNTTGSNSGTAVPVNTKTTFGE